MTNQSGVTFGKYGTKHGIHHFVTGIPLDTHYLINAALSFRTWQNKFCGFNSYNKFCLTNHINNSFPMSLENALRYLKWLDQERKVCQDTAFDTKGNKTEVSLILSSSTVVKRTEIKIQTIASLLSEIGGNFFLPPHFCFKVFFQEV